MYMDNSTRRGLKLPKTFTGAEVNLSQLEKQAIGKSIAVANHQQYRTNLTETESLPATRQPTTLREDTSELMVITFAKKLTAYVMTVTQKSPKHFRFTFVTRLQNYCLDVVENLLKANSLRTNTPKNKFARKDLQHDAYTKLKLIDYIAFLAYENQCLLKKQYEQIATQVYHTTNLLLAWTKSDQAS